VDAISEATQLRSRRFTLQDVVRFGALVAGDTVRIETRSGSEYVFAVRAPDSMCPLGELCGGEVSLPRPVAALGSARREDSAGVVGEFKRGDCALFLVSEQPGGAEAELRLLTTSRVERLAVERCAARAFASELSTPRAAPR